MPQKAASCYLPGEKSGLAVRLLRILPASRAPGERVPSENEGRRSVSEKPRRVNGTPHSRPATGSRDPGRTEDAFMERTDFLGPALLRLHELEGRGIDAIPKPRRFRPVRKHVAEMGVAPGAQHFGPCREKALVLLRPDGLRGGWFVGARPSGPRVELRIRQEQLVDAGDAPADPPVLCGPGAS